MDGDALMRQVAIEFALRTVGQCADPDMVLGVAARYYAFMDGRSAETPAPLRQAA